MKRVLITGAAGFTGHYMAPLLAAQGNEVHGLTSGVPDRPVEGYSQLHDADLRNPVDIRRTVSEVRPDYVIHLGAIANVAHDDVDDLYRVNIVGTRNLLEILSEAEVKPTAILLASSANIYGNGRDGLLDEETPPAPANDYGVSKLAMEYVASIYSQRLPIIIVRPFNYTGIGQGSQFIISKIVEHARKRASVVELGNLDVARDFSDVRTVVDAYARLMTLPEAIGQTVNVCSGRAVSLGEIISLVTRLSGHQFDVRVNPDFVRSNEVKSLHGSREKIEKLIGPLRRIPLEETLQWMLDG